VLPNCIIVPTILRTVSNVHRKTFTFVLTK